MGKLWSIVNALKAGESLKDQATWKNRAMLGNVFVILIGTLVEFFPDLGLNEGEIVNVAYGLAIFAGAWNTYFHAATSTKVGIPSRIK